MDLQRYARETKYRTLKNIEDSTKTQTRIAEDINRTQTAVGRVINHLEDEGCVKNKSLLEGYKITDRGRKLLKNLEEIKKI